MSQITPIRSANVRTPQARIRPVSTPPAPPPPSEKPKRRRKTAFRKSDVARAISAVTKAGIVAGRVEVTQDGTIRIYAAGAEPTESLFDQWADKL